MACHACHIKAIPFLLTAHLAKFYAPASNRRQAIPLSRQGATHFTTAQRYSYSRFARRARRLKTASRIAPHTPIVSHITDRGTRNNTISCSATMGLSPPFASPRDPLPYCIYFPNYAACQLYPLPFGAHARHFIDAALLSLV